MHDLGFIFLSTFGRWLDLLPPDAPESATVTDTLVTAATVQSFRWNGIGSEGFVYSFNGPQSLFVDVMMNVRLLFWAAAHGAEDEVGSIESVKAVAEVFSPISGEVVAVNGALEEAPEKVNDDPYGEGWLFELRGNLRIFISSGWRIWFH